MGLIAGHRERRTGRVHQGNLEDGLHINVVVTLLLVRLQLQLKLLQLQLQSLLHLLQLALWVRHLNNLLILQCLAAK